MTNPSTDKIVVGAANLWTGILCICRNTTLNSKVNYKKVLSTN